MAKTWKEISDKLRKMDRREFLDRSRQELSKRADAMLSAVRYDFASRIQRAGSAQPGKFFFRSDQVENLLQLVRDRLPEQAGKIIERAEKICSHRFDLLGYTDLDYGQPIDWHLDAVHQKNAPWKPFHRIRYLDFAEVGDSKVTWELNRHQHLVTLAKAYRLTGSDRFAREILSQWGSWHAQNPYPIGINWASSLEVGFRGLSWIWMHAFLEGTKFLTADFHAEYLRAQALNARHIERYLSTYFSPNTHLLGEAVALFFLGTLSPELRGAERWKSQGWQMVLQEAARQINPDGMHFEQSVYYHVYALDFFLHAALLASANGVELPADFENTLERMLHALYLLGRAGPPPRFGDDDGGRLFDSMRNRDEHLLDPLATGAVLFGRGDFKALSQELCEETIWLLGEAGVLAWDSLEPQPVPVSSASLESSGIYILVAPPSKSQLIVKSGPSRAQTRGHAHADAMSLCLQSSGHALLIDAGAYEYVGEGGERNLFRGTAMHNTLTVDGQDQAEPDDPFSWKQEIGAKTERWIVGETFDLIIGSHSGYSRLPDPVTHRRWIVGLRSGAFLVRDVIEGEGEHRLELSWQLSPDLQMQQKDLFRVKQSSQGLAIVTVQSHGWSEEVHKGPWSPVYGLQRSTTVLKFGTTSRLPAEFVTLLAPLPEANARPGKLSRAETSESVCAYRFEANEVIYQFFFGKTQRPWVSGQVASDGEFVCITTRQNQAADIILCHGTYVELDGKRVVAAAHAVARYEVVNGETVQVFCSDPSAITNFGVLGPEKTIG
ncbi:MAG: putative Heparinase family protein [Acidobacteriaceae bacterium]|nr:putative Heparinase family protein [Acidobacteriaceae bacterium]